MRIEKLSNGAIFNDYEWPPNLFQGRHIIQRQITRKVYKAEIGLYLQWQTNRKSYNGAVLNDFERPQVTPLFNAEYLRNGARYRHDNELLTETYVLFKCVISNDFEWLQWHEVSRGLSATAELLVLCYVALHRSVCIVLLRTVLYCWL